MPETLHRVLDALKQLRVSGIWAEYDLHAAVAGALSGAGLSPQHEMKLAPRCRIDFWVDRVGIEVKKGRPPKGPLLMQARRYADQDMLDALVVVVEKTAYLPTTLSGKPVHVVALNRLWGVALP